MGEPAPPPTTTTTAVPFRLVADVKPDLKSIDVFDAPDAPAPKMQLSNPDYYGLGRVFLVDAGQGGPWLKVDLPVRPNGSPGWIKIDDVNLTVDYWLVLV